MLVLSIPLFTGKVYTHIDLGAFHLPSRAFYQECLRNGDSFLWDPNVLCGHYVHGEGQGGYLHPYHYLLYRFFPLQVAFNLELLLCYPATLIGCFLLFRRWSLSRAGALLAAFIFTFSGFGILRAAHPHLVEMTVHLPWLLLAIDCAFNGQTARRRGWAILAVALLTASELLLGYPQFVWIIGIAEAAYTIVLTIRHRHWATPLLLGLAKGIGLLIGAAQWLPSYEFLMDSDRIATANELRDYLSLHPLNVLQLLNPFLFEYGSFYGNLQEFTLYAGVVCTVLLAWACLRIRARSNTRSLSVVLVLGAVFALLLAFGPYTGFHKLVNWIPLVAFFKGPCRYLVLFFFAIAGLAGLAYDDLLRRTEHSDKRPRALVVTTIALMLASWLLAVLAAMGYLDAPLNGDLSAPPLLWWGPLAMTACAVLIVVASYGVRAALPLLFVLATLDQTLYGIHFLYWWNTPTTVESFARRFPAPDDLGPYRLYSARKPENNGWTLSGHALASGLAGVLPVRQLTYDNDAALRAAGVAYKERPGATYYSNDTVTPDPDRWIPVADPVPRAYLVSSVQVSDAPSDDIREIDLRNTALVEHPLALERGPGEATIVESRPGNVQVHVQTESTQLLILVESFHHGWNALTQGGNRELEILRVNGDFMGVVVQPGLTEIQFRFEPASFRTGTRLSLAGLVLMVSYLVIMLFATKSNAT